MYDRVLDKRTNLATQNLLSILLSMRSDAIIAISKSSHQQQANRVMGITSCLLGASCA